MKKHAHTYYQKPDDTVIRLTPPYANGRPQHMPSYRASAPLASKNNVYPLHRHMPKAPQHVSVAPLPYPAPMRYAPAPLQHPARPTSPLQHHHKNPYYGGYHPQAHGRVTFWNWLFNHINHTSVSTSSPKEPFFKMNKLSISLLILGGIAVSFLLIFIGFLIALNVYDVGQSASLKNTDPYFIQDNGANTVPAELNMPSFNPDEPLPSVAGAAPTYVPTPTPSQGYDQPKQQPSSSVHYRQPPVQGQHPQPHPSAYYPAQPQQAPQPHSYPQTGSMPQPYAQNGNYHGSAPQYQGNSSAYSPQNQAQGGYPPSPYVPQNVPPHVQNGAIQQPYSSYPPSR